MKKEFIFILYDLGLSLSSLSKLYRFVDVNLIENVIKGDYLELQFEHQLFTQKDLELLGSIESINRSRQRIKKLLEEFKQNEIEYFIYYENGYPELLKKIPLPPFFLFMKGNRNLFDKKFICSIVGTRTPTDKTKDIINQYVKELVANDVVTASGLALGTDINVHLSTLENGGKTIAVLPGSITSIVPTSHTKYAEEILQHQGLLVSEYYMNESFKKDNYINRNRIISGISNAVIIAECKESSGTMHTARFAYKQNKKIFCFDNDSSGVLKILKSSSAQIYKGINSLNLK